MFTQAVRWHVRFFRQTARDAAVDRRWLRRTLFALLAAIQALAVSTPAFAQRGLPEDVVRLLTARPFPEQALDPQGRYMLLVQKRGLLPPALLGQHTLAVGGQRVDPDSNARRAAISYSGLTLVDIRTGHKEPLPVPPNTRIGYPQWSPDGSRFFFTVTTGEGVELWMAGNTHPDPVRLIGPVLNAARAAPCTWMRGGTVVLCRMVARKLGGGDHPPPAEPLPGLGTVGLPPSGESEEELAEYCLRSQLVAVDPDSGEYRPIGDPAVFESVRPSPDGAYLVVARLLAPYPRTVGEDGVHRVREVWDESGQVVRTLGTGDAGMRAVQWQPPAAARLVWVERRGGKDNVSAQSLPFPSRKQLLYRTAGRFAGLEWLDGSDRGLVSDYEPRLGTTRVWLIGAGSKPRLVGSRDGALRARRAGNRRTRLHRARSYSGRP